MDRLRNPCRRHCSRLLTRRPAAHRAVSPAAMRPPQNLLLLLCLPSLSSAWQAHHRTSLTTSTRHCASPTTCALSPPTRRAFLRTGSCAGLASALALVSPRPTLAASAPGSGVLGTWGCEQKGVEIASGELSFESNGDVTLTPPTTKREVTSKREVKDEEGNVSLVTETSTVTDAKDPILSASNWNVKADKGGKAVSWTMDYPEEVLTYKATLDDSRVGGWGGGGGLSKARDDSIDPPHTHSPT